MSCPEGIILQDISLLFLCLLILPQMNEFVRIPERSMYGYCNCNARTVFFFLHENSYSVPVITDRSYISGFPLSVNLLSPFQTSIAEFTAAMRQGAGIPSPP